MQAAANHRVAVGSHRPQLRISKSAKRSAAAAIEPTGGRDIGAVSTGDRSDPYPARQNNGLTNRIISAAFDHAPGVRIGSAPERDFGGHMRRQAKTADRKSTRLNSSH